MHDMARFQRSPLYHRAAPIVEGVLEQLWKALLYCRAVVAQLLLAVDAAIQRGGYAIAPSKTDPKSRQAPSHRRNIHRGIFTFIFLAVFFTTRSFRNKNLDRSHAVPVLGARENPYELYFPPLGDDFRPKVARYNFPPRNRPRTPLFIPFSRNNTMLKQAVLSYIAAGWPRSDIVIIDNTGTMDANQAGMLTMQNPFYLDYELFRRRYGVSILQTPTYLSFAQLQNFLNRVAISRDWPYYFWSHMDVAVLSNEESKPYRSFYRRVLDILYDSGVDSLIRHPTPTLDSESVDDDTEPSTADTHVMHAAIAPNPHSKRGPLPDFLTPKKKKMWSHKFFSFDYLALVNVPAQRAIGQWDVFIPFYHTDCDFYARASMLNYRRDDVYAGPIFDIASVVEDPETRFFPPSEGELMAMRLADKAGSIGSEQPGGTLGSWRYKWLKAELKALEDSKNENEQGRNTWQAASVGVPGFARKAGERKNRVHEPWSYDPRGFQAAWWAAADNGRQMYIRKWGTLECELDKANKTIGDAWVGEYLKEGEDEWKQYQWDVMRWFKMLEEEPIR